MAINTYQTNIIKKENLNIDTLYFQLKKPANYDFKPGQFLQIFFENLKRSYSIFSKPSDQTIDLCIKCLVGGEASEIFKNITVGENINISDPMGHFIINEDDIERTYVATGSGIAPIVSMLRTSLEDYEHKSKIYLLFGIRYEEDIFYIKELEELSNTYKNFSFDFTLSRPSENWKGNIGRVSTHLPSKITDKKNNQFYLCGSPDMVKDIRKLLIDSDVDMKNIKFEIF